VTIGSEQFDSNPQKKKEDSTMPIYEFKCSECETFFEVLVMKNDEEHEIKCPKCSSSAAERVVSATNYAMGASSSGGPAKGVTKQERTCSSGSCTTYNVAGESRG
jgi:putative FmdB family regulatory protein